MTEVELPGSVHAVRIVASHGPDALDDLAAFFVALDKLYGYAAALEHLNDLGQSHELDDALIDKVFEDSHSRPMVSVLSMRSPLTIDLMAWAGHGGSLALGFFITLLTVPSKVAKLPALHAKWHEGRLRTEIFKAKRDELRKRLRDGDIDVLALDDLGRPGQGQ